MLSKKPTMAFFLTAALVVIFTASSAMAFCDYCPPEDFNDPVTGWTAKFLGVTQIDGCTPYNHITESYMPRVEPCYKHEFQLLKGSSYTGVNFLAFLLPDCCTDKFYLAPLDSTPENIKVYKVGQGEPTDKWGINIKNGFVVSITPNGTTPEGYFALVATTELVDSAPVYLRESNKIKTAFKLASPGCTAPIPPPEGLKTTEDIKSYFQTDGPEIAQTDTLITQQAIEGPPYQICLKAVKNVFTKCYEAVYYSCFPPLGDCNDVPDYGWVPFVQYPKEPTLITQYSGEPACENVIRIPDNAAYNLCYSSDIECAWPKPLPTDLPTPYTGGESCDVGADQTVSDGSFANPCYPANRCVECNFGGYPYCACW